MKIHKIFLESADICGFVLSRNAAVDALVLYRESQQLFNPKEDFVDISGRRDLISHHMDDAIAEVGNRLRAWFDLHAEGDELFFKARYALLDKQTEAVASAAGKAVMLLTDAALGRPASRDDACRHLDAAIIALAR